MVARNVKGFSGGGRTTEGARDHAVEWAQRKRKWAMTGELPEWQKARLRKEGS